MLKPKKKITRKEIKRDPLIESTYKVQNYINENKSMLIRLGTGIVAVIVILILIIGKNNRTNAEIQTAMGKAVTAYARSDFENAQFQFEYLIDQYGSNKHARQAGFYLGKIFHEQDNAELARRYLEEFLKVAEIDMLISAAHIILADIDQRAGNLPQAIKHMKSAVKSAETNAKQVRAKVELARLELIDSDVEAAKKLITGILEDEEIPPNLKQPAEELSGLLLAPGARR